MDAYHRAHHQLSITVPRVNQKGLPIFDDVDRIPYTNQITYGITQRLIGKPEKEGMSSGPYEYAKLNIFQSYSLGDPFQTDSKGKGRVLFKYPGRTLVEFQPLYLLRNGMSEFNPYQGNLMYGMPPSQ